MFVMHPAQQIHVCDALQALTSNDTTWDMVAGTIGHNVALSLQFQIIQWKLVEIISNMISICTFDRFS